MCFAFVGLRVSGSRNGVSGSRGVFFPEWCFQFRRVRWFPGCFQFPGWGGWGVFSSQIRVCCSRNGVLGARGCFLFPEWCFRFPARGDGMAVFVVPVRCFFLLLLASLLFFVRCFLPFFFLFSLPVIFVSFPPFLPSPFPFSSCASFNLPSILPFLASCPCFLPIPFLSVSSPSRIPFPYLAFLTLMPFPVPSLP